ncbi:MAG: glycosyltransferase [Elusimicrobia bacterium]|nr:glycosyltransferase [Elusimicrobiota bacterium]
MAICAILIVYNRKAGETRTLKALLRNYAEAPAAFSDLKLIIYDNSPEALKAPPALPFESEYVHSAENKGLAEAYNYALGKAAETGRGWLLLLDQDSDLPGDFISALSRELRLAGKDPAVYAVVPKMRYKGEYFSPSKDLFGGTVRPIDMNHKGVCDFKAFAIGSACAVRVSFLRGIGGFDEFYWLDFLDRWLFASINKRGGKVYVTDSVVEHELSILDYDRFMSEKRYANILTYETAFMREFKPGIERYVYYLRLVKRIVYLFFTAGNKSYSLMTLNHLKEVLSGRDKDGE